MLSLPHRSNNDGRPPGTGPRRPELVFAAYNTHDPRCGRPPGVRNTSNPELYHGYFENRYSEQFVLTFDRATGTGTVSGGDLEWDNPKSFTLELLDAALHETQKLAARIILGLRPPRSRNCLCRRRRAGAGPPHWSDG